MCEMGCGRKAEFACGTACEYDKDGKFLRGYLFTCLPCGQDVRWTSVHWKKA